MRTLAFRVTTAWPADPTDVAARAGDLAQDQRAEVMETERAVQGVVQPRVDAHVRKTLLFAVDVSHAYRHAEALAIQRVRVLEQTTDEHR